jgi:DNA-damage-inducible protein J
MAQTVLSVRMSESLKDRFDYFCKTAGMTASTAVNMFVRAALREKRIPFEIKGKTPPESADPFYSASNMAAIDERIADIEAGRNCHVHDLIEADDDE